MLAVTARTSLMISSEVAVHLMGTITVPVA
jgi:hypothetical protein